MVNMTPLLARAVARKGHGIFVLFRRGDVSVLTATRIAVPGDSIHLRLRLRLHQCLRLCHLYRRLFKFLQSQTHAQVEMSYRLRNQRLQLLVVQRLYSTRESHDQLRAFLVAGVAVKVLSLFVVSQQTAVQKRLATGRKALKSRTEFDGGGGGDVGYKAVPSLIREKGGDLILQDLLATDLGNHHLVGRQVEVAVRTDRVPNALHVHREGASGKVGVEYRDQGIRGSRNKPLAKRVAFALELFRTLLKIRKTHVTDLKKILDFVILILWRLRDGVPHFVQIRFQNFKHFLHWRARFITEYEK
mmetsp:Transcript_17938/g.32752  ORF Transcript_17938/g.32752 Transcript_17938/m.32752 type:complete len:302 (+) Transcript_17938:765-1670(+)